MVGLVRVVEPILTLAGRWETCAHILDLGVHAATTIRDAAAAALFQHQLGTLNLCLERLEDARRHLSRALELRRRLNDPSGLARHRNDRDAAHVAQRFHTSTPPKTTSAAVQSPPFLKPARLEFGDVELNTRPLPGRSPSTTSPTNPSRSRL